MNGVLTKELNLLMPALRVALVLAIVPVWLVPNHWRNTPEIVGIPFALGLVLLAISSFGREFSLQTFPLLMAQPVPRARVWWTKVMVLALAMLAVFVAWIAACAPRFSGELDGKAWRETLYGGAAALMVIFTGGLWTTLLLRQLTAALWFTILLPAAIVILTSSLGGSDRLILVLLTVYSIASLWFAWKKFLRAEEVGWTGGVISFGAPGSAQAATEASTRGRRPLAALVRKEFKLQQIGLMGIGLLFVLHLGVVLVRHLTYDSLGQTARSALELFGAIWFMVPALVGSPAIAEERKLGTMDAQRCLPAASWMQFGVKLVFAIVIAAFSAVLFWAADSLGPLVGRTGNITFLDTAFGLKELMQVAALFAGGALLGFYASTLSRNIIQALAIAVVFTIGVLMFGGFASHPSRFFGGGGFGNSVPDFNFILWRGDLIHWIAWPTLALVFVWLAWVNFRYSSRVWLRNTIGIAGSLLMVCGLTMAVYHRAWELFMPLEPAHGPAVFQLASPPRLDSYGGRAVVVLLPDSRAWVGRFWNDSSKDLPGTEERRQGNGQEFAPGSNWVSVLATFRETVGIRADGTLWVSERPRQIAFVKGRVTSVTGIKATESLVQFGHEINWQTVVRHSEPSVLLLKRDGSLWRWGNASFDEKQPWPGLRSFEPRRLGADADWASIVPGAHRVYAWKRDGSGWTLHRFGTLAQRAEREAEWGGLILERLRLFDNVIWKQFKQIGGYEVGLRNDGTLWTWRIQPVNFATNVVFSPAPRRIGNEDDWTSIATFDTLAATKADGSLWQWTLPFYYSDSPADSPADAIPTQVGKHRDWVAVGMGRNGIMSLAADGSLWSWHSRFPISDEEEKHLIAPSRRPKRMGSMFD